MFASRGMPNLLTSSTVWIVGIDMAWGEKKGDGLCLLRATRRKAEVQDYGYTFGDEQLLRWLKHRVPETEPSLILIDAPIIIANQTGTRPVDRLTHRLFHRQHAACHPANLGKCPRPVRLGKLLEKNGYTLGWELASASRLAAEVYPHPAMVRLFRLERIIKYKKGTAVERRVEFRRLQRLLRRCLREEFPDLKMEATTSRLLREPWTKPVEDRTDALFCALIGYHHWRHRGKKSDPIGDRETGFILIPAEL